MGKLFEELKRRKVFRIAGVYAVVGWVLAQVAAFAVETFAAPQWVQQIFVVFLILGFPLALILAWAYEVTPEGVKADDGTSVPQTVSNSTDRKLIYVVLGLVTLLGGLQVSDRFVLESGVSTNVSGVYSTTDSSLSRRYEINLGVIRSLSGAGTVTIALSPDGHELVFATFPADQNSYAQVYIRELNQLENRLLADPGFYPQFSPDGDWILYGNTDGLAKIPVRSGATQTLLPTSEVALNAGFAWMPDGNLLYPSVDMQLMRIAETGGVPERVSIDRDSGDSLSWPSPLPGGENLLLTISERGAARTGQIALLTQSSGAVKPLIQGAYNARYVPTGHIVFMRSNSLWAVPFDLERLEVSGREVPVIADVQSEGNFGMAVYTFSNDGLLIYLPGGDVSETGIKRTLIWVDREGNEEQLSLTRDFRVPVVSPDGQRLAVVIEENGNQDIWTYDLARDALSRLTFDASSEYYPLWTPDGERIVFSSGRNQPGLWWRSADGTGQAELLLQDSAARPYAFTADGSQLVYETDGDLFLLTLNSESTPAPLLQSAFTEARAALSPDGNWIAYESDESGRFEIYVRPFPDVEAGKWQISNQGGQWPRWNPNGRELLFRGPIDGVTINSVWAAQVATQSGFQFELPRLLVEGQYRGTALLAAFDVSPDGSKFMLISSTDFSGEARETRLIAVENWFAELARLAPPDPD